MAARDSIACRIYYDLESRIAPLPGDYLVSQGKTGPGSVYLIVGARVVRRRKPVPGVVRWDLACHRCPSAELITAGESKCWPLYWYPRDKKRQPKSLKGRRI